MPTYIYACHDCEKALLARKKKPTTREYEKSVLFETSHQMFPSDAELLEARECPRCHGTNCDKSFHGMEVTGYVRGNGYLDKTGTRRDMTLHHLTEDDPYAEYRIPGEVDELKTKLRRGGRHKSNSKYFDTKVGTKEVKQAITKTTE